VAAKSFAGLPTLDRSLAYLLLQTANGAHNHAPPFNFIATVPFGWFPFSSNPIPIQICDCLARLRSRPACTKCLELFLISAGEIPTMSATSSTLKPWLICCEMKKCRKRWGVIFMLVFATGKKHSPITGR
jgi:hypothetical protein